jgi:hypothetical protein
MADNGSEGATQLYELFDERATPRPCGATLPVQRSGDEYTFVQFLPIGSEAQRAVLPTYALVANDALAGLANSTKERFRKATAFAGAWTAPAALSKSMPVVAVDAASLIAHPEIELEGKTHAVSLDAEDIASLLAGQPVRTRLGDDRDVPQVLLVPPPAVEDDGPARLPIGDLSTFLADPILPGFGRIPLSRNEVEQLTDVGVARVEIDVDGNPRVLVISADGTDGIATERSALSTAGGGAKIGWSGPTLDTGSATVTDEMAYELPAGYEFVLALPFAQRWTLKGYTRGELLNSIPLAPQEETTIEVFTWDRHKRDTEETTGEETESGADVVFSQKPSLETLHELTRKNGWSSTVEGKLTVPIAEGAGIEGGLSSTDQHDLNDTSKRTEGLVSDVTAKAASRLKTTRQSKVTEVVETGIESRTTRKIKNQNFVRTLTLDYFEVLASHDVSTALERDSIELCVLVDNLLPGPIDRYFVLQHEGVIRKVLRDATYKPGFGAARLLDAFDRHCEVACAAACACSEPPLDGDEKPPPNLVAAADLLRTAIRALAGGHWAPLEDSLEQAMATDAWTRFNFQADASKVLKFQRWLFRKLALERANPRWWNLAAEWAWSTSRDALDLDRLRLLVRTSRQRVTAASLPNAMLGEYADLLGWLTRRVTATWSSALLPFVGFDDANLEAALGMTRAALTGMRLPPFTPGSEQIPPPPPPPPAPLAPPPPSVGTTPKDPWTEFWDSVGRFFMGEAKATVTVTPAAQPPPQSPTATSQVEPSATESAKTVFEATEPSVVHGYDVRMIAMAQVEEGQLLNHLKLNQSFYRQAIWGALDPNDRYNLLLTRGDRLFDYVENRIAGFVGSKAAMPFRLPTSQDAEKWFEAMVTGNDLLRRPAPEARTITVPTPAVGVQSRLGGCDTAESFVMEHRRLDVELREQEVALAKAKTEQATQEARRFKLRLDAATPVLDDPTPHGDGEPIRISLDR